MAAERGVRGLRTYLSVKNAAEVSWFLYGVDAFHLNQLSQCLTGRLIAPSRSQWCVNVVHKYGHPLSIWRSEHVAHSLYHEAFHGLLKHDVQRTQQHKMLMQK